MAPTSDVITSADIQAAPWWIKFAYTFGVSALLAVGLVWFLTFKLYNSVMTIESSQSAMRTDISYLIKQNEIQTIEMKAINLMLYRVCVRLSNTDALRDDCFSEGPPVRRSSNGGSP